MEANEQEGASADEGSSILEPAVAAADVNADASAANEAAVDDEAGTATSDDGSSAPKAAVDAADEGSSALEPAVEANEQEGASADEGSSALEAAVKTDEQEDASASPEALFFLPLVCLGRPRFFWGGGGGGTGGFRTIQNLNRESEPPYAAACLAVNIFFGRGMVVVKEDENYEKRKWFFSNNELNKHQTRSLHLFFIKIQLKYLSGNFYVGS